MSGRFYRALSVMHQKVQEQIEKAEQSPKPDWLRISELKRRKLSIKDQMRVILERERDNPSTTYLTGAARPSRRGAVLNNDA